MPPQPLVLAAQHHGLVLPLADCVGLAIGAMTWKRSLSIGILADAALSPDIDKAAVEMPTRSVTTRRQCIPDFSSFRDVNRDR